MSPTDLHGIARGALPAPMSCPVQGVAECEEVIMRSSLIVVTLALRSRRFNIPLATFKGSFWTVAGGVKHYF